jgi:hypothetical protein
MIPRGGQVGEGQFRHSGSGKVKEALQDGGWRKEGWSCFYELRWSGASLITVILTDYSGIEMGRTGFEPVKA